MSSTDIMIKSVAAGIAAIAIDKFVLQETDINNSLILGVSTTIGIYTANLIGNNIPDNFKSNLINGKKFESDLLELGGASALSYGVTTGLFNYDVVTDSLPMKFGVIVASDVIGTYISDYLTGKPLAFLQ